MQLLVERVRGNDGHAGRVAMWVADTDPHATHPSARFQGRKDWDAAAGVAHRFLSGDEPADVLALGRRG